MMDQSRQIPHNKLAKIKRDRNIQEAVENIFLARVYLGMYKVVWWRAPREENRQATSMFMLHSHFLLGTGLHI